MCLSIGTFEDFYIAIFKLDVALLNLGSLLLESKIWKYSVAKTRNG